MICRWSCFVFGIQFNLPGPSKSTDFFVSFVCPLDHKSFCIRFGDIFNGYIASCFSVFWLGFVTLVIFNFEIDFIRDCNKSYETIHGLKYYQYFGQDQSHPNCLVGLIQRHNCFRFVSKIWSVKVLFFSHTQVSGKSADCASPRRWIDLFFKNWSTKTMVSKLLHRI